MISSNLSRSMKCYLHPVLTCPLATDACLEQKKNHSTIDIIYLQLLMNFKKHSRSGLWEACENVKDKGCEPQTNHFFLKMWIKGRLIEVLVKDLENRWIVDGKKKKSLSFQEREMMWFDAIPVKLEESILLNSKAFWLRVDTAETAFQHHGCFSAVCSQAAPTCLTDTEMTRYLPALQSQTKVHALLFYYGRRSLRSH